MSDTRPHVLREYALLADGERGALIGPSGDICWLCAPYWHSDAVLTSLIGGRGVYAVTPHDRFVWGGRYEDGTLIWQSRWMTDHGVVWCRDALAFPGDAQRLVLLRRISAPDHRARFDVTLDLRSGYGRSGMTQVHRDHGVWTGRCGGLRVRWTGGGKATRHRSGALRTTVELDRGEQHDLVLELSSAALPTDPPDADNAWEATEYGWSQAVPELSGSVSARDARHSYAVLRGLTSSGGGMVAAATTSLPERADRGRNYDYRYVWIRDQALTGQAIATTGAYPLLDDAVRFVSARLHEHGARLAPAYTVHADPVPDERQLRLPGYPGGNDVLGNQVRGQFQLDIFGEALSLLAAAARLDRLESRDWRAAEIAVDAIAQRWTEPDAGIWELQNANWTESRLACVAGLRAAAGAGAPPAQAARWLTLADTIFAEVAATCTHPSGRWQRAPDDAGLDAALVLPQIRGAVAADDPRTDRTMSALLAELADDHYLYRFRQQPGPLDEAEGAFLLCGFLMAISQHQRGAEVEAFRWFERNRSACGPPSLFSEEYDVTQRQLRGNLPQAFVHALMIEASVRLAGPPAHRA